MTPEEAGLRSQLARAEERLAAKTERADKAEKERDRLREAFDLALVGGNHLAGVLIERLGGGFASEFPPNMNEGDQEASLRRLSATDTHEIWQCWAALMRARASLSHGGKE